MGDLEDSVLFLEGALGNLESAVGALKKNTARIDNFNKTLETKLLFDVLPERLVLQRPLKIRKMVKPIIEKDSNRLDEMLERLKRQKKHLQQQSKILKLKLEKL